MRKFYTLLVVAMTAIAARATDYKVPVTVIVNRADRRFYGR